MHGRKYSKSLSELCKQVLSKSILQQTTKLGVFACQLGKSKQCDEFVWKCYKMRFLRYFRLKFIDTVCGFKADSFAYVHLSVFSKNPIVYHHLANRMQVIHVTEALKWFSTNLAEKFICIESVPAVQNCIALYLEKLPEYRLIQFRKHFFLFYFVVAMSIQNRSEQGQVNMSNFKGQE